MVRLPTRLELAHEHATGIPDLAEEPTLFYDADVPPNVRKAVPLEKIVDFAAKVHEIDAGLLSHLAIWIHRQSEGRRFSPRTKVTAQAGPESLYGKTYFPIIDLRIRSARGMNHDLRHELRHLFQPAITPLYNRPKVRQGAQLVSGIAAVTAAVGLTCNFLDYQAGHDSYSLVADGLLSAVAANFGYSATHRGAVSLLASLDWQEYDAELFSYRYYRFTPIAY